MRGQPCRVFISYRRADAAGYAGRLEASLEKGLGRGSVFRDIQDIGPGADFVSVIRKRLAGAQAVLVLIGPGWAGGEPDGARRIDDPSDLVRLEVQEALASKAHVVPVLLPGADMPTEASLPEPLKPLARLNAMSIHDPHWDADIARLLAAIAPSSGRRVWPWALASAVAAAAAVAAVCAFWPSGAPGDEALIGRWQASVRYDWGDRHDEIFEFKRHAGGLTGTASFLGYPRPIEGLRFDGVNLHFETRSQESMGAETRDKTHRYAAELQGPPPDQRLLFRLQTSGGFGSPKPLEFEARPVQAPRLDK